MMSRFNWWEGINKGAKLVFEIKINFRIRLGVKKKLNVY